MQTEEETEEHFVAFDQRVQRYVRVSLQVSQ